MIFTYEFLSKNYKELEIYLKNNLSSYRYNHILEVAKLAKKLAHKYHEDENDAYLCGLLHDLTKEWDREKTYNYMCYYDCSKINKPYPILHQYTCCYFLKENGFRNDKIIDAIYHHSTGKSNEKLAKIIYLSDKLEPTRRYDTKFLRELAFEDLETAFEKCRKEAYETLKK